MRFNRIFFCFLAVSLLFGGCGWRMTATKAPTDAPATSAEVQDEAEFPHNVIFVGDSTTAHMASRAKVAKEQVWATKSRYLNLGPRVTDEKIILPETGESLTVAEAAGKIRPAYLVVTLGIDYGVYYYREEPAKFAFYYEKLLDAIASAAPDTTLILQSIFPVGRESAVITNEMVDAANLTVRQIAEKRGLVYLNVNPLLKDAEGYLAPKFCSSADGIHLSAAAYNVILKNLAENEGVIREHHRQ